MYAVVDDRNQQYRVAQGDKLKIHLHKGANEGDTMTFDKVCAVGGDGSAAGKVGTPFVSGASVTAKVIRNVKGPKVIIGKFRRRKNHRKRTGFRAQYTMIQIESING
ncbi:MAG: 50S ribosomal protein L21 [Planctomycetota bacterium]